MWSLRTRILPLLGVIILVWAFFFYSFDLVSRMREARTRANETIAWFWAGSQVPLSRLTELGALYICSECGTSRPAYGFPQRTEAQMLCSECGTYTKWYFVQVEDFHAREQILGRIRMLFRELVDRLDYITVLTDTEMRPQIVDGAVFSDTLNSDSIRAVMHLIEELGMENEPIPILGTDGETVGYLYYGSDSFERELLLVPYVQLGIVFVLALLFIYFIGNEMKKEKELAWIGFAKETAHQISTPLSSLMGWLEILRERPETASDAEMAEALDFIGKDVERLGQIASRYGQMGKKPKLKNGLVNPVILDTLHYICSRPGFTAGEIEIETDLRSEYPVMLNRVLLSWVIENLLKNSVAAAGDDTENRIVISTRDLAEGEGSVEIEVADSGRGIPFSQQRKIFKAGFTTRRGGWGLGLTLSRRIVEKHHGGALRLKASSPGRGAVFVILLPSSKGSGE